MAISGEDVAAIVDAYLIEKDQTADAPDRLRYAWAKTKPHFGHYRPDQITKDLCRSYTAHREADGISCGTIRKELGFLRAALRWHEPQTKAVFELPGAPPPKDRHLTRAEFFALLDGAEADHVELFILLALTTAGRKTAILDLTWDRVDFERGIIRLGTGERRVKGRATVPMNADVAERLAQAKKAALTEFVIEWAGKRVANVKNGFARACARAGLEDVTPHVLRHTAAVWMAEDGVPMAEIAQFLGHSDSRVTERVYARFSPTHLRKAGASLNWRRTVG